MIRPARVEEAEALSELAFRSKAHWGYDASFMEACREELSVDAAYLEGNPTYVLEAEDRVAGFYSLEQPASGEAVCVEVGMFFVDPEFIGRGLGRAMMRSALEQAKALGYRQAIVQSDPNAAGFYRAAGFREAGWRESESVSGRALPLLERHWD